MTKYRIVYTRDELDAMRREATAPYPRPATATLQPSAFSRLEIAIVAFLAGAIFGVLALFTLLELAATIWR